MSPTLGDLCEAIVDCEHRTAQASEDGIYPLVRTPDIGRGVLLLDRAQRVDADTYAAWTKREVPRPGDLILAREAPVGNAGFVPAGVQPVLGQRTVLIRTRQQLLDARYLTYLLSGDVMRSWMDGVACGSTVPHLNMADIRAMPIPTLPTIATQRKIAAILSAYDDLIENNSRRIKLLEEIAQRIYREWFVDFRYPGHEDVRLVDSELGLIPEGWHVMPLPAVAHISYGYPFKSHLFNTAVGLPVIRIRDIPAGASLTRTTENAATAYLVDDGDILVGMDGDFHMARWTAGRAWLNQRVARFRPKDRSFGRYWLYLALEGPIDTWNQAIVGTTVAHLGKRHLDLVRLVVPPEPIRAQADSLLETLFDDEMLLRKSLRNLGETRELLLPRLISGEINVDNLDIAVEGPAA